MPIHSLKRQTAEPAFLTLRAAAALLGLHPNTVRAHVQRGIIAGAGLEERDDGAALCAHERQALAALCRSAEFSTHSNDFVQVTGKPESGE